MTAPINLNKYRKRKARAEKEKRAAANRQLHGRTGAQKAADRARRLKADKELEGKRLDSGADDPTASGEDADR